MHKVKEFLKKIFCICLKFKHYLWEQVFEGVSLAILLYFFLLFVSSSVDKDEMVSLNFG